jgi:hypothetical protein
MYFSSAVKKTKKTYACSPKFHFDVYLLLLLETRFSMHVKASFASKENNNI